MKNILIVLLAALFIISFHATYAFAQGQGIHTPGTGITNPEMKQQGTGQGLQMTPTPSLPNGTPTQSQLQDRDRLQLYLTNQDQIMQQDRTKMQDRDRLIYQDQDRTVLGAMVLRETQKTIPTVDPLLAQLGQQIQQSTQTTIQAEKTIRERNQFMKLFFGSDQQAVQQMEQTATQNKQRLQQVTQLVQQCLCDVQVKNILQQQVSIMNQEQDRLLQLAAQEKKNKGLFNWGQ